MAACLARSSDTGRYGAVISHLAELVRGHFLFEPTKATSFCPSGHLVIEGSAPQVDRSECVNASEADRSRKRIAAAPDQRGGASLVAPTQSSTRRPQVSSSGAA